MQNAIAGRPLRRVLGAPQVALAAVSYVVASSTLVSDLSGWLSLGAAFLCPLLAAFGLNILLCLSVADLSASFPRCGAIHAFANASLGSASVGRAAGVFLALVLIGLTALAGAGEIATGALSLRFLVGGNAELRWYVAALVLAALIPNLVSLRLMTHATLLSVALMLGLRWLFDLVGFLGDHWAWPQVGGGGVSLGNALSSGLGLAFWSFVGVEILRVPFSCSTRPTRA